MTKEEISRSENQNISGKDIRESEYQEDVKQNLICWYPDTLPPDTLIT